MLRWLSIIGCVVLLASGASQARETVLHNASYDPTREFYVDYNRMFATWWRQQRGEDVEVSMSHGGSGAQTDAVLAGQRADVVSLATAGDVDRLAVAGLLAVDWRARLPHRSAPYTSTVVFLVRRGNPKRIADWGDLVRDDVDVVTPDPKTSGGGRWAYLAAWAWASREYRDGGQVLAYMRRLFANAVASRAGARGATLAFVGEDHGDVLLAWENEALRQLTDPEHNQAFEIVYPSLSIRAEPAVAVLDRNADRDGVRALADAYLQHLYAPPAQSLAAQHHYRPSRPEAVPASLRARFRALPMVDIDSAFGGWPRAQAVHFADGGLYDHIAAKR
ncbi:MAG: sulfate ABC transporter substrate-binding protein [Luteimonas sp.]